MPESTLSSSGFWSKPGSSHVRIAQPVNATRIRTGKGLLSLLLVFPFAPLLKRASEIALADKVLSDQKTLKRLRDEVSVIRRDIASAFSENSDASDRLCEGLDTLFTRFRSVVDAISRRAAR